MINILQKILLSHGKQILCSKDIIFIDSKKRTLAFSPPIPAWMRAGEDSRKTIKLLKDGKRNCRPTLLTSTKRLWNWKSLRLRAFLSVPCCHKKITDEPIQRNHAFLNLNPVTLGLVQYVLCLLRCRSKRKKPDQKPLGFWVGVVQESLSLGASDFVLSGGEPSIYPHFVELIKWINSNTSASISVLTNGYVYTDEMIDRISKKRTNIQISIDGVNAETHGRIRGKVALTRRSQSSSISRKKASNQCFP